MRSRLGISKVAVSAVLLVLGVAAAVMAYVLSRGAIFHFYTRAEHAGPKTEIQIINFNPNPSTMANITLRNMGPEELPLLGSESWQVVIDNTIYSVVSAYSATSPPTPLSWSDSVQVGESFILVLSSGVTDEPHDIAVYGPYGVSARAGYSP